MYGFFLFNNSPTVIALGVFQPYVVPLLFLATWKPIGWQPLLLYIPKTEDMRRGFRSICIFVDTYE